MWSTQQLIEIAEDTKRHRMMYFEDYGPALKIEDTHVTFMQHDSHSAYIAMTAACSGTKLDYRYTVPAHDFMREKYSAHFWVFVLTLVDNYLPDKNTKQKTDKK